MRVLVLSLLLGLALVELPADAEDKTGNGRPAADPAGRPPAPILLSVEVVPDPPAARAVNGAAATARPPAPPSLPEARVQAHQLSTAATAPVSIAR